MFTTNSIPDLSGKNQVTKVGVGVITVTRSPSSRAGTEESGFQVASALASKGAHVIIACHSQDSGQAAAEKIRSTHPKGFNVNCE
ncbi:hypothetical protein HK102_002444 [Quaeritorhiza haematococci]|nr:hypothetical protein HK102_002444 [Quaeritorhiza haematococci]